MLFTICSLFLAAYILILQPISEWVCLFAADKVISADSLFDKRPLIGM